MVGRRGAYLTDDISQVFAFAFGCKCNGNPIDAYIFGRNWGTLFD
jgi:hypothetical protein